MDPQEKVGKLFVNIEFKDNEMDLDFTKFHLYCVSKEEVEMIYKIFRKNFRRQKI